LSISIVLGEVGQQVHNIIALDDDDGGITCSTWLVETIGEGGIENATASTYISVVYGDRYVLNRFLV